MEIVIATHNIHKIRELRALLKAFPTLDVYSLLDFPQYKAPPETGTSFEENASLKAVAAAQALGRLAIADDSGLVVPALNGSPGVFSSRFAGEEATDADNRRKLLKEMEHLQDMERQGYFECCLSLASPQGLIKSAVGQCEGLILSSPRGSKGFGYDSLFVKFDYGKTFAELDEETKNRVSHRRKAFDRLAHILECLISQEG
jgi:XTP/dITP diphosphohydrolase